MEFNKTFSAIADVKRTQSRANETPCCYGSTIKQSLSSIQIQIYIHAYETVPETIDGIT